MSTYQGKLCDRTTREGQFVKESSHRLSFKTTFYFFHPSFSGQPDNNNSKNNIFAYLPIIFLNRL
jgi:hypothetical protein